jgi:urease accessory protein
VRTQTAPALFAIALIAGAAVAQWPPHLPTVDLINIISALILGAMIAVAVPLPVPVYLALALLFGVSHGYANGTDLEPAIKPYVFIPGVGLAGLVFTGYIMKMTDYVLRRNVGWMTIAVRVAGSWIVATALLVLATSWKRVLG